MLTDINATNRQEIADLLKGPIVCLHIIFMQEDIEGQLEKSKQEIAGNIFSLLASENFVGRFIGINNSALFTERAAHSLKLSSHAQHKLNELIHTIQNCDVNFMQQLAALVEEQDDATKIAYDAMLDFLTKANKRRDSQDNTYCENTYSNHPRSCCCEKCFKPLEYIERGVNQACNLLWSFAATVQHAWENSHFDCFSSHRKPEENHAPVEKAQGGQPKHTQTNSLTMT